MHKIVVSFSALLLAATALGVSLAPAEAASPAGAAQVTLAAYQQGPRFEQHGSYAYYNGHEGYRTRHAGYREYNGYWFPPAAFGAAVGAAILGGIIGNSQSHSHPHAH